MKRHTLTLVTRDEHVEPVDPSEGNPAGSPDVPEGSTSRRRFLGYVLAAPMLVVGAQLGLELATETPAAAAIPSLPQPADIIDLGDILILAGLPTANLLYLQVASDGTVHFVLPRQENGQGLITAIAMLIADEMDVALGDVEVTISPADPALVFNQLTGSSNSIRSLYNPVRTAAATARARLVAAAAGQWGVPASELTVTDGVITSPTGQTATYGSLSAAAASPTLATLAVTPKPPSEYRLVGTPTSQVANRAIVTGQQQYTLDLDIPGAMPTMVRRAPTIKGTLVSFNNPGVISGMPGVLDVAVVPTGVAIRAETFGQAIDAVYAVDATWAPGPVADQDDETIRNQLIAALLPLAVPPLPLLSQSIEADFDWAFANHAAMQTNCAIADVRPGSAQIWAALQSPIDALQTIAAAVGLPQDAVTVNVIRGGGSFGRTLFFDAALEAALISKAMGKPVKLMWHRIDDMRHGRLHPQAHHKIRATYAFGQVLSFEHRVADVQTDFGHGLGEMLTAEYAHLPVAGNLSFAETLFETTITCPYNFGIVTQLLSEVPLDFNTASMRSVYSYNTRGVEEVIVDELAQAMGQDPVGFRMSFFQNDRQRAVLDKVATEGNWGRPMPSGMAQGVGFHQEYQSMTACLVEIDATNPSAPRVTKAVIAVDVGLPINPRSLEGQMMGGLNDAISLVLTAGIHMQNGLPLETSYSDFRFARQGDSPLDVQVFVMPPNGEPGGAGELGVPAAVGAIANAYARATGIAPRSFPIIFPAAPVPEPVPPGQIEIEPNQPIPARGSNLTDY